MPSKKKVITPILEKYYKCPKFSTLNSNEEKVTLADFTDNWLVLYFYPKDMTSGCTTEAIDFQNQAKKFSSVHCQIVGVSKDSCVSHQKFATKENLKFTLLSDTEGKMCEAFSVWKEKSMYGKKYMGIERSTFLINPEGFIVAEWRKVKVTNHVDEVFKILKQLQ
ncbi:thioredoxin-dependent thiol peroxidase [Fluviispira multicolorata]|uniref:thioredoxin-dependent peroxiredoxin n=1 Tax=Fluviispira multicolorata TaxID=2654512 RepID=A0A833JE01_9BACT|nr:thioredoxin-dependent thiol peroxidase [Fluviispira multicolorata]KAB8032163.1 thioredoxin-dependent thiol peroxidase [Fluviispira multicolorata]